MASISGQHGVTFLGSLFKVPLDIGLSDVKKLMTKLVDLVDAKMIVSILDLFFLAWLDLFFIKTFARRRKKLRIWKERTDVK